MPKHLASSDDQYKQVHKINTECQSEESLKKQEQRETEIRDILRVITSKHPEKKGYQGINEEAHVKHLPEPIIATPPLAPAWPSITTKEYHSTYRALLVSVLDSFGGNEAVLSKYDEL